MPGWPELDYAIEQADLRAIGRLVNEGADVNQVDPTISDCRGRTPLQEAEHRGHVLAVELLRDQSGARADPG